MWKKQFYIKPLKNITSLTLITTHLVSGTCVQPHPMMCCWNEVQDSPVYDGNMADCGHEGSSAAVSLFHCEHLREQFKPSELFLKNIEEYKWIQQQYEQLCNMNSPFNVVLPVQIVLELKLQTGLLASCTKVSISVLAYYFSINLKVQQRLVGIWSFQGINTVITIHYFN